MNEAATAATKQLLDYGAIGILLVLLIFATYLLFKRNDAANKAIIAEKDKVFATLKEEKDKHIESLRNEIRSIRENYNEKIGGVLESNNIVMSSCQKAITECANNNHELSGLIIKWLGQNLEK